MNYQQATAAAIRQITFQNADAAITAAEAGFGFLSCFHAAAAMATDSLTTADAAVDAKTAITAAEAGSGFLSFCAAAATAADSAADADAAASQSAFLLTVRFRPARVRVTRAL